MLRPLELSAPRRELVFRPFGLSCRASGDKDRLYKYDPWFNEPTFDPSRLDPNPDELFSLSLVEDEYLDE